MAIKKHKFFGHQLVIDFRYQSINCYRLISIAIDCYRLSVSSIDHAGIQDRGGHGGVLNTATPQKKLTNTASSQEKSTKLRHRDSYF